MFSKERTKISQKHPIKDSVDVQDLYDIIENEKRKVELLQLEKKVCFIVYLIHSVKNLIYSKFSQY